jgi:hypothetical protein
MNILRSSAYLVLSAMLFTTMSSNTESDIIYWNDGRVLTWEDFQGDPRYDYHNISALTSSGIVHYRGCENGQIIYQVRAYFETKESWYKQEAHNNYILAHEQVHFDITELYARKLRKALDARKFACGEEAEFEAFVDNFLQGWENKQSTYDIITRHSLDKDKQLEWAYKIAGELSLLEDFEDEE